MLATAIISNCYENMSSLAISKSLFEKTLHSHFFLLLANEERDAPTCACLGINHIICLKVQQFLDKGFLYSIVGAVLFSLVLFIQENYII